MSEFLREIYDSLENIDEQTYIKGDLFLYDECAYEFLEELLDYDEPRVRIREYRTGLEKIITCDTITCLIASVDRIIHKYVNKPATEGIIVRKNVQLVDDKIMKEYELTNVSHHPSSNDGVVIYDIVHPCQYLFDVQKTIEYVAESERSTEPDEEFNSKASRQLFLEEILFKSKDNDATLKKATTNRFNRKFVGTSHQWLPHRIQQSETTVSIGKKQPNISNAMSEYLCQLLYHMLPDFQRTYNYVLSHPGIPDDDYQANYTYDTSILNVEEVKEGEEVKLPNTLQFYLKVVDIKIDPFATHEGVWHVEGLPEEHIIATGIYYLDCPLTSKILYKRDYTSDEIDFLYSTIRQSTPASYDRAFRNSHMPLGEVTITGNSTLFFPNTHIHKVQPIYNDTEEAIHRQCVVFFMVDPKVTLFDWDDDFVVLINTGDNPAVLKANMQDRMLYKDTLNPREINFCEH